MKFDQGHIHNLAAEMFWRMADEGTVATTIQAVLESGGRCLLSHGYDADLWQQFPLASLPVEQQEPFLNAVADEALLFARQGENMTGQVYLEDRDAGRSPSAAAIDTSGLNIPPTLHYTVPIERIGRLCLRHPLPAVVFATARPEHGLIEVDDTTTALGFQLPMLLQLQGAQEVAEGVFLLVGYFHIPVPDEEQGNRWRQVIQNASCKITSFAFHEPRRKFEAHYSWALRGSDQQQS